MSDSAVVDPPLVTSIHGRIGQRVAIDVRRAEIVSQHMTRHTPGKRIVYVTALAGGHDFVAYLPEGSSCPADMRLVGTVVEIEGRSKGPKDATYRETQLDVDDVRCL